MKHFILALFLSVVSTPSPMSAHASQLAELSDVEHEARMDEVDALMAQADPFFVEGGYKDGIRIIEKALEISEIYLGEGPYTAHVLTVLGLYRASAGQYEAAEKDYLRAASIHYKIYPDSSEESGFLFLNTGLLYLNTKQYAKAELFLLRALTIAEELFEPKDETRKVVASSLARFYHETGRATERDALMKRYSLKLSDLKAPF